MSLLNMILQKLRELLQEPNPNQLDVYVICDCQDLSLNGNMGEIGIPHLALDFRPQKKCLAMYAKRDFYMVEIKKEARAIAMRDEIFLPNIYYACRFYNEIKGIQLPQPVPVAED